jgi:hypothetical protein
MKKLGHLFIVMSFVFILPVMAPAYSKTDPFSTDLMADQTIDVGDIFVWDDGTDLSVKFVAAGGWCLEETHLHVSDALSGIPQTKNGNPIPGKFQYKMEGDGCPTENEFTIHLEWESGTEFYIAAHAEVTQSTSSESEGEDAWGAGINFPGSKKTTYFKYTAGGKEVVNGPDITIETKINGEDADEPPGPSIVVGGQVTWSYVVTNTGNVVLKDIKIKDDKVGAVTCNPTLGVGESMTCTASGDAILGQYSNIGTATGTAPDGKNVTAEDSSHYLGVNSYEVVSVKVPLDIKPESCPNPLNVKSRGALPVAILGTKDLDVYKIDVSSITLEGVKPTRSSYEDEATPFEPFTGKTKANDCNDEEEDGFIDLILKFNTQDIITALGSVTDGEVKVLHLNGKLTDGTPIEGEDVVVIKNKFKQGYPK